MSQGNLNPNPIPAEPKTRFELSKHTPEKPFFSGVKMFIAVVVSLAALAASVLGGVYILVTGPPADFYQKPVLVTNETKNDPVQTSVPEKSDQDKVTDLMADYQEQWNGGSFPSSLVTSDFQAKSMVGETLTSASDYFNANEEIIKLKVLNITQISRDELAVTTNELIRYDTGIGKWFSNAGGTDQEGDLVVERIIEHEYRLVNSGSWRIKSRAWKRQTPALIQQAGELTLSYQLDEGTVQFDDRRPSKESLEPFYNAIASDLQGGFLSYSTFPSNYSVTFDSGGTIGRDEIQGRLSKIHRNVRDVKVTYTIDTVEQTGPTSAEATVRFVAEFIPRDSTVGNRYVAVWRDLDTWTRPQDTETTWTRTATRRTLRSPLWQHYENKRPPEPPASPATGDSQGDSSLFHGE